MICPHCGAPATQQPWPNGEQLYVADGPDGYDFSISQYECSSGKHTFYTDDTRGNENINNSENDEE